MRFCAGLKASIFHLTPLQPSFDSIKCSEMNHWGTNLRINTSFFFPTTVASLEAESICKTWTDVCGIS
uniref:Uncharacterized protein n=1 Tax=Callorhinchus milii TaxID=7868 RepID=A0A4W3HJJ3_CALMI